MRYVVTFCTKDGTEISFYSKKDFNNQTEANNWFEQNITFDDRLYNFVTVEPTPLKRYKVAFNRIMPSFVMMEAQNETEAKEMTNNYLENEGCPGWDFLMVKEEK